MLDLSGVLLEVSEVQLLPHAGSRCLTSAERFCGCLLRLVQRCFMWLLHCRTAAIAAAPSAALLLQPLLPLLPGM